MEFHLGKAKKMGQVRCGGLDGTHFGLRDRLDNPGLESWDYRDILGLLIFAAFKGNGERNFFSPPCRGPVGLLI